MDCFVQEPWRITFTLQFTQGWIYWEELKAKILSTVNPIQQLLKSSGMLPSPKRHCLKNSRLDFECTKRYANIVKSSQDFIYPQTLLFSKMLSPHKDVLSDNVLSSMAHKQIDFPDLTLERLGTPTHITLHRWLHRNWRIYVLSNCTSQLYVLIALTHITTLHWKCHSKAV